MKHIRLLLFCLLLVPGMSHGQIAPAIGLHENTPNVVAMTNARIVISPGRIIENGTLLVRGERIAEAGEKVEIPADAVVRDMNGMTLYPGFIDLFSQYGMPEKEPELPDSPADHWNDAVHPETSAAGLFAPDETTAGKYRSAGFTTVATYPRTGIFRGNGALVLLGGGTNGSVIADDIGQAVSLRDRGKEYPRSLMGSIALIRQTFLDTDWYTRARSAYEASPAGKDAPELNRSLEVLSAFTRSKSPAVFITSNVLEVFNASNIADEFGLFPLVIGNGDEYRRLDAVKESGVRIVVPLDFPDAPDVSTDETSLRSLKHWYLAPENPGRLARAGIYFSLSTGKAAGDDFLENLRSAVKRGLDPDAALTALTATPADWLGKSRILGSLEEGKYANIVVTKGSLFSDSSKIIETWVAGKRFEINPLPENDVRGTWSAAFSPDAGFTMPLMEITGDASSPTVKIVVGAVTIPALKPVLEKRILSFAFPSDSLGIKGIVRMSGIADGDRITGRGTYANGTSFTWRADRRSPFEGKQDSVKVFKPLPIAMDVTYPEGIYGRSGVPEQPAAVLFRNATVWTSAGEGVLENTDILVKKGKIAEIGKGLNVSDATVTIDASGKHITAGLIDAHSHLAVTGGINEGSHSITSETRISDVIDCDDINIYRQMAGGLTSACILHGSANSIGGQNSVIKLKWGALSKDMINNDAMPTIKFALGENVKQSNVTGPPTTRYPRSRMGVAQFMRDSFQAAKDYRREWEDYDNAGKKKKNLIPPRRDLRLEPLVEVLDGKRFIHCHSYRQDEIEAMIAVADDMGFKVRVFIHNLEGYKVADLMKRHGSMPTVFSDWWAYKIEVYDSIPYNGAMLYNQGLIVSYNSDDTELARRMNLEAAKAVKYGGVPPEEALKFVTINPAAQLGIDKQTGSIEKGKDADLVVWSGSPLSVYSICEQTWIDGSKYFDIDESAMKAAEAADVRNALVQRVLTDAGGKKK